MEVMAHHPQHLISRVFFWKNIKDHVQDFQAILLPLNLFRKLAS